MINKLELVFYIKSLWKNVLWRHFFQKYLILLHQSDRRYRIRKPFSCSSHTALVLQGQYEIFLQSPYWSSIPMYNNGKHKLYYFSGPPNYFWWVLLGKKLWALCILLEGLHDVRLIPTCHFKIAAQCSQLFERLRYKPFRILKWILRKLHRGLSTMHSQL